MARQPSLLDGGGDDRVVDVDIAERMEQSFLDYSMSVIVGRALPDVRDGLKPVQRRILHAMLEAGLRADRPHRKCAAAVGDVMKKYHPHGDQAIYDALVRMAQDFSMRDPLVDGRGNFGSIDGDPPAAKRYTECRLSAIAMELLDGLDEDTVDFRPNYDGFEREPVGAARALPEPAGQRRDRHRGRAWRRRSRRTTSARSSTPSLHLLAHPDATVETLMRFVPGPDFPTGARILAGDGMRDAYLTGRGAITHGGDRRDRDALAAGCRASSSPRSRTRSTRARCSRRSRTSSRTRNASTAIRDLRDESSRDGMRIVIELKRGEDPAKVLDRLYTLTDLRTNFNANIVALVDGAARDHRPARGADRVRRAPAGRCSRGARRYRRDKAAARAHVLEGLLIALDHLDEVIALIRAAPSADEAPRPAHASASP